MDPKERYFWDLNGYLVVKGVMSKPEIDSANAIVDRYSDRIKVGGSTAKDSTAYAGTGRPMLPGILEFPEPDCLPFRNMLAHPAVVSRLRVMCHADGRVCFVLARLWRPCGGRLARRGLLARSDLRFQGQAILALQEACEVRGSGVSARVEGL